MPRPVARAEVAATRGAPGGRRTGRSRIASAPRDLNPATLAAVIRSSACRATCPRCSAAAQDGIRDEQTMAKLDAGKSGSFKLGGELKINRLGFGAMRLTGQGIWGEPEDRPEALRTLKRVPELGIDFIDTADSYGPDVSEELIHEALFPY